MSPNSGFYTSKRKKSFLQEIFFQEMKIQLNKDWKIMMREIILDMYGSLRIIRLLEKEQIDLQLIFIYYLKDYLINILIHLVFVFTYSILLLY